MPTTSPRRAGNSAAPRATDRRNSSRMTTATGDWRRSCTSVKPMVRVLCCAAAVLISSIALADTHNITAEQRRELISRAQIWRHTDVAAMNLRTGPQGHGAFPPDATVTCTYHDEKFAGASP